VYEGMELFQKGRRLQSLVDVPGVAEGRRPRVLEWTACLLASFLACLLCVGLLIIRFFLFLV
jgi:hypothetical protein